MPAISRTTNPPAPVQPEACDVRFNHVPDIPLDRICNFLHVADISNLSRVSPVARDAVWWTTFEAACGRAVQQTHQGELRPLVFDATRFADKAIAPSHPNVAFLRHLADARARLATIPTTPATRDSVEIPGLVRYGASGVVLNVAKAPFFVGEARDGEFRRRVVLCPREGPPLGPEPLRGTCLTAGNRTGGVSIHGATPSAADTQLVIRANDGRLAVLGMENLTFDWLPEAFRDTGSDEMLGPPLREAALSADGRYVAAMRGESLVVFDRKARVVLADVPVPPEQDAIHRGFSVDSSGTVVLAAKSSEFHPERGWRVLDGSRGTSRQLLVLCPNERYLLSRDDPSRHLVLVDRQGRGDAGIELRTSGPFTFPGTAVAFSATHDVVAVANGDDTIDLFDLTGALAAPPVGVRPVEPRRTLVLPETRFADRSLRFSPDGSRLDVVYKLGFEVEFVSFAMA